MRKLMLIGRSGCGKTTLTQALKGMKITYQKTQYVNYLDMIIDTPGEYMETRGLSTGLAVYSCEADIIGVLLSAVEPYSLYPPNITCMVNREVIGIVTKIDEVGADKNRAEKWLRLIGCRKIFFVNSKMGDGIPEILKYLNELDDITQKEQLKGSE